MSWWARVGKLQMPLAWELVDLYLTPPSSSAECERVFSCAGRLCRAHRASMVPETIKRMVKTKYSMLMAERNGSIVLDTMAKENPPAETPVKTVA